MKESGRCVHTSEIGVKFQVGAGMMTIFQVDCKQTAESAEKKLDLLQRISIEKKYAHFIRQPCTMYYLFVLSLFHTQKDILL